MSPLLIARDFGAHSLHYIKPLRLKRPGPAIFGVTSVQRNRKRFSVVRVRIYVLLIDLIAALAHLLLAWLELLRA